MTNEKKDLVIDVCGIPPLPETLAGFGDSTGEFSKYNELYSSPGMDVFIKKIMEDPTGFLVKLMDDAGVDKILLTAEDAETSMGMITPNNKVAEFVATNPDRFMYMGAVDPHKGMKAVRELEHYAKEYDMKCLTIEPCFHKLKSNDKLYYPIYAKCVELDLPIWIHTSINFVPSISMDFGRPIYLDEVAGHFPELKIIAGHGGWPWVNELMGVLWRHENVYADTAALNPKYLEAEGSGWDTFLRYGNTLLKDKILYASAWPALDLKSSVDQIKALSIKDEVKIKWLGGNARKLLKI